MNGTYASSQPADRGGSIPAEGGGQEWAVDPDFAIQGGPPGTTLNNWDIPGDGTAVANGSSTTLILPTEGHPEPGNYTYDIVLDNVNENSTRFIFAGQTLLTTTGTGNLTASFDLAASTSDTMRIVNIDGGAVIVNRFSVTGPN